MVLADPPRDAPVHANVIVHLRADGSMTIEKWPTRHLFDPDAAIWPGSEGRPRGGWGRSY